MFTTVTVNHLRLSGVVYAEALKGVGALNGMNKVLRIHVPYILAYKSDFWD